MKQKHHRVLELSEKGWLCIQFKLKHLLLNPSTLGRI